MKERVLNSVMLAALLIALVSGLSACSQEAGGLQDGYYTAEAAQFDAHGWKGYVVIYVSMGRIITADYNAFNHSGFVKSWDIDYMRIMNLSDGTYPNEFTRVYADALVRGQDPAKVDVIAGATHSHATFQKLAAAAISSSEAGDKHVALVYLEE